jgi:hypothetical protein
MDDWQKVEQADVELVEVKRELRHVEREIQLLESELNAPFSTLSAQEISAKRSMLEELKRRRGYLEHRVKELDVKYPGMERGM